MAETRGTRQIKVKGDADEGGRVMARGRPNDDREQELASW
jgi:hypothetical protein